MFAVLLIVYASLLAIVFTFVFICLTVEFILRLNAYFRHNIPFSTAGRWNNGHCYRCQTPWTLLNREVISGFTCYDYYYASDYSCPNCHTPVHIVRKPSRSF